MPKEPSDRLAELTNRFAEPVPSPESGSMHALIRGVLLGAADHLDEALPGGREKKLAMARLEECLFWSLAAVDREHHPRREQDMDDPDMMVVSMSGVRCAEHGTLGCTGGAHSEQCRIQTSTRVDI